MYDLQITKTLFKDDGFIVHMNTGRERYRIACPWFSSITRETLGPSRYLVTWQQKGYPDDLARAREKIKGSQETINPLEGNVFVRDANMERGRLIFVIMLA